MREASVLKGAVLAVFACICLSFPIMAQSHGDAVSTEYEDAETEDIGAPISEARLDAALEAYGNEDSLQTERPEWSPEPREIELREPREVGGFAKWLASVFTAIGPLIGYILLAVVVLVLLIGLYLIFGESLSLRRRQKPKKTIPDISETPDLRPEEATAAALLEDADALAAAGRFAEAVHLLLFRSIEDIQSQQQGSVPRSLTAREIGSLGTLPGRIRNALSPIIGIVERSFFGGREVDAEGWNTARASYQDFAFGEAWT